MPSSSAVSRNNQVFARGARDVRVADGLGQPNPSEADTVRLGQAAMARKRRAWDDWMLIGEALELGRAEAMRTAHTNKPEGKRYEQAMGAWLLTHGFKEIDKGTRCRLLDCVTHRAGIEAWRATLTDSDHFRLNHPDTVLRKWRASTTAPGLNAAPKPSPFAKLKEALIASEEEMHRLQREIELGGGDLWTADDHAADIAKVIVAKLSPSKAETVARAILKQLKVGRAA